MFALLVTREIATDIDIKILGVPPLPGPGIPFLDIDTCAGGGGGVFISVRVFFPV